MISMIILFVYFVYLISKSCIFLYNKEKKLEFRFTFIFYISYFFYHKKILIKFYLFYIFLMGIVDYFFYTIVVNHFLPINLIY